MTRDNGRPEVELVTASRMFPVVGVAEIYYTR